jgi:DNA-3-methyladenine glycosylase
MVILTQDALIVAPALLGCEIITNRGGVTAGLIVEVEAYHGDTDPASHAFRRRTPRTEPMFLEGGHVYTYFSYGNHVCMNVVTGPAGQAQAVLIRALQPSRGLDLMAVRRGLSEPRLLAAGPGRLTQALAIALADSGKRLGEGISLLPAADPPDPALIASGPRIGVSQARDQPWRFYLRGNPFVSRNRL